LLLPGCAGPDSAARPDGGAPPPLRAPVAVPAPVPVPADVPPVAVAGEPEPAAAPDGGGQASSPAGDRFYQLAELVDQAVLRSHWIAAQQAFVDERRFAGEQAAAMADPVLGLTAGRKSVSSDRGPLYEVSFSQPFLYPGKRELMAELGAIETDIAHVRSEEARAAVAADVVRLAYRHAFAQRKRAFLASRRERFELIRVYLEGRVFASPQAAAEREIIESRLGRLAAEALAVEGRLRASHAGLTLYVNWDESGHALESLPDVEVPWLPVVDDPAAAAWLDLAAERNFDLEAQRRRARAAEMAAQLAREQAYPDFTLSAFYGEERAGEDEHVAGFGISFPLLREARARAGTRSAERRLDAELSLLRLAEQRTNSRLGQVLAEYSVAAELARRYPQGALSDRAAPLAAADEEFRKGRLDLLTLLELDAEVAETTMLAFDAQVELADRLVELLYWAGEPDPMPWFGAAGSRP
jgi:outer membrane protein TolC